MARGNAAPYGHQTAAGKRQADLDERRAEEEPDLGALRLLGAIACSAAGLLTQPMPGRVHAPLFTTPATMRLERSRAYVITALLGLPHQLGTLGSGSLSMLAVNSRAIGRYLTMPSSIARTATCQLGALPSLILLAKQEAAFIAQTLFPSADMIRVLEGRPAMMPHPDQ